MIVAVVAKANNCILITDNVKHFPGINLLNPLRDS
jgi:predicted nucleic acid-binding protein